MLTAYCRCFRVNCQWPDDNLKLGFVVGEASMSRLTRRAATAAATLPIETQAGLSSKDLTIVRALDIFSVSLSFCFPSCYFPRSPSLPPSFSSTLSSSLSLPPSALFSLPPSPSSSQSLLLSLPLCLCLPLPPSLSPSLCLAPSIPPSLSLNLSPSLSVSLPSPLPPFLPSASSLQSCLVICVPTPQSPGQPPASTLIY